jgi:predicted transcriptional regulator
MMEIYHDILIGLERESKTHNPIKRTRVQQHSNLSYDKFSRHLDDMAARGLVVLSPLSITQKGREFVREYNRIRAFMRDVGARFFEPEPPLRHVALELVASLPSVHHSVLLYEDRQYADLVAAAFLSEGLAKGESCVYLTLEDPKNVERRLINLVENFSASIRENQLRIYSETQKNRRRVASLEEARELVDDSTKGMKPPFRIFGDYVHLFLQPNGVQAQLSVEKLFHKRFDRLGITLMCWYDLGKIPRTLRRKFVESIVEQHSHVIFGSDPAKAFAFDSSLLRTEA